MKNKKIILILSSFFIITVFWIISNVYHNSVASTISEALGIRILPISPNFDTKTIEKLKKRESVSSVVENKTPSPITTGSASTPTVSLIPSPVPSPTATVLLSPAISQSISPATITSTPSGGLVP